MSTAGDGENESEESRRPPTPAALAASGLAVTIRQVRCAGSYAGRPAWRRLIPPGRSRSSLPSERPGSLPTRAESAPTRPCMSQTVARPPERPAFRGKAPARPHRQPRLNQRRPGWAPAGACPGAPRSPSLMCRHAPSPCGRRPYREAPCPWRP